MFHVEQFKIGLAMNLKPIIEVLHLAESLVEAYTKWDATRENCTQQEKIDDLWAGVGKIAAENAAKPEIQGYSEHD